MMAETYFLQALQAGIRSIQQDTEQLAYILTALSDDELNAAKEWFGNLENVITVAPGFPMETTRLPFIGVTIADDTQIEGQTPIGLDYYTVTNPDGTVTETRGARFNGFLKGTIYTPDANLIVWISTVCKWALLAQFDWLGDQGFNNLNISLGDFEPSPQFLPIFTFARGIFLRGEYDAVFLKTPQIQPYTGTGVVGSFNPYEGGGS
jgi:hypothetical protein